MTPNWFVAWPVAGLDDFLTALESDAPGGLRFLAPSDLHVTLAFLGPLDGRLAPKMNSLLNGLPLKAVEVRAKDLIALPQPRRFSAISLALSAGLSETNEQIEKWRPRICREAGAPVDTRAPLPHVTVARPERRIGGDDRSAVLEWIESRNRAAGAIPFRLDRPRLFTCTEPGSTTRYSVFGDPSTSS